MLTKTFNFKRQGSNLLELLLALCILTGAFYPLMHIFRISIPTKQHSQKEMLATLLAHHVMESIIAKKITDPQYLPQMSDPEPIVSSPDSVDLVSEYFRYVSKSNNDITESESPELYWSLKPYSCRVDTYFLEGSIYKVIVNISYEQQGRIMNVFFERLLAQNIVEGN